MEKDEEGELLVVLRTTDCILERSVKVVLIVVV